MTTIDHQQAAVEAVAYEIDECAMEAPMDYPGAYETAMTEAVAYVKAAEPHLRAKWAAELGATFQSGERWNETYRNGLRTLQYEKAYLDGAIDILALLEGGAE